MSNIRCCPPDSNCNLPVPCINPLVYLMKMAIARAADGYSISTAFQYVLNNGVYISGSSKYCCPDCISDTGFYFLGSIVTFRILIIDLGMDGIGSDPLLVYPCCIKTVASTESSFSISSLFIGKNELTGATIDKTPECCDVDFTQPIERLALETTLDSTISQSGWIEASSFNDKSGINILLDFIDSLTPTVDIENKSAIFEYIHTVGLAVKCDDCGMRIVTASAYSIIYS